MVSFLLLGGVNAVLYNITHYRLIQITSSTITPVIGGSCRGSTALHVVAYICTHRQLIHLHHLYANQ